MRSALTLVLVALVLAGCEREERAFRPNPVGSEAPEQIALSPLVPGAEAPQPSRSRKAQEFENNAYHVSQGKTFYAAFNCNGCHANGGGGSGPALIDETWIYGGNIENIVATIRDGRPNGMPSFRGKIPDDQIWEIAAYVRSMSGTLSKDVASGRRDAMQARPAENRLPPAEPKSGHVPPQ